MSELSAYNHYCTVNEIAHCLTRFEPSYKLWQRLKASTPPPKNIRAITHLFKLIFRSDGPVEPCFPQFNWTMSINKITFVVFSNIYYSSVKSVYLGLEMIYVHCRSARSLQPVDIQYLLGGGGT